MGGKGGCKRRVFIKDKFTYLGEVDTCKTFKENVSKTRVLANKLAW